VFLKVRYINTLIETPISEVNHFRRKEMKFTIELNDRGSSVINCEINCCGIVTAATVANLGYSDYGSSREYCEDGILIDHAFKDNLSKEAIAALKCAALHNDEEFEFEDDSCYIL
jgi:hypothetical protein